MNIELVEATLNDASIIHELQIKAFSFLLEKYKDYATNPGAEDVKRIIDRINQPFTDYYIIRFENVNVGGIRIIRIGENHKCRISPIFIIPEYQKRGIAQEVFKIIEGKYKPTNGWNLDTIAEEDGNCYLYEKMGYIRTKETKEIKKNMHIVFYEKKGN